MSDKTKINPFSSFAEIRKLVEQKLISTYFFDDTSDFVEALFLADENVVYNITKALCDEYKISLSYVPEDYNVKVLRVNDHFISARVKMPKPQETSECDSIYFVYDMEFSKNYYFTVEKAAESADGIETESFFLCGITSDGMHMKYGKSDIDEDEVVDRIRQIVE